MAQTTFADLGIAPTLLAVLTKLGYTEPTPIQAKAIPTAVEGKDVVGIAQTGTGKTLAFGIPLIQRLGFVKGQALVLLPTRELALQVEEVLNRIGRSFGLRTVVLIGGAGMGPQVSALRGKPHVIVATPGRLIDHLEHRTVSLEHVVILVLDEADRMLDMGFAPQIKKILAVVPGPQQRQTMLFSATMPHDIMQIATHHMKLPIRIEVAPQGTTAERVTQEIFIVDKQNKIRLLEKVLNERPVTTLVFTRTKHGATKIMRNIRAMGHSAAEIHGNRSLGQRKEALEGFKNGRYRVLVATDIASRGIDVTGIGLVINYDLPTDSEDYVHRIGRTARAGTEGHAISFAEPNQRRDLQDIERLIRKTLPISQLPNNLPPPRAVVEAPREYRNYGRAQGRSYPPRSNSQGRPSQSGRPTFHRRGR
ncbi:MAG TPA: DEAD/DEAH box helicase [Candidatus Paceibacterota bacterium]